MRRLSYQRNQPLLAPNHPATARQESDYETNHLSHEDDTNDSLEEFGNDTLSNECSRYSGAAPTVAGSASTLVNNTTHQRPLIARLGIVMVVTNVISFIGLAASISAISWIWFGNENDDKRRRLILDDYVTIAVTISSIFIRVAVATQVTSVVAMLAALTMEISACGGIRLKGAPALSIARYSNSGALSSLLPFWYASAQEYRWPFVLVLVMACTSIVSQFTSTLLLRDLKSGSIIDFPREMSTTVGFEFDTWLERNMTVLTNQGRNYWTSPPVSFPSFAEWYERPQEELVSVRDTGPSLRAFLPIPSAEIRTSLKAYQGIGDAFDTRVFCSRPIIQFHPQLKPFQLSGELIHGNLTDEIGQFLRLPTNNYKTKFSFSTKILQPGGLLFVLLQDTAAQSLPLESINAESKKESGVWVEYQRARPGAKSGGWIEEYYLPGKNAPRGGINMTVCYDALFSSGRDIRVKHHQSFSLRSSRTAVADEPTIRWNATMTNFDTTDISRHYIPHARLSNLTAPFKLERESLDQQVLAMRNQWSNSSFFPRHNLSIVSPRRQLAYYSQSISNDSIDLDHAESLEVEMYDFVHDSIWQPFSTNGPFIIAASCRQCSLDDLSSPNNNLDGGNEVFMHPVLGSIARDVLEATNNDPAVTWQALLTTVLSSAYYDWLPAFSRNETAIITTVVQRIQPQYHTGYVIAMATVALQLIIFFVVLTLFWRLTRFSLLDNAWQSVSQIVSAETIPLLIGSTMAKDGEIKDSDDELSADSPDGRLNGSKALLLRAYDDGRVFLQR
ncbi:hypothetical protein F4777DRAFT_563724 [Nemania sp. FL0916]|nr:hypothetical protein F4777DRAFT_563724 [Nemania sp. FL0916]